MTQPITEDVVTVISDQCPDVTEEHVAMVLAAWNTVLTGDPLGTILMNPADGATAVRVSDNGVHKWRVTATDGGVWADMQPTLAGWTVIYQP